MITRLLLSLSICVSTVCAQADLWVDANATQSGVGTRTQPFTSIQSAIDAAAWLSRIHVLPGIYSEQLVLRDKWLTISSTAGPVRTVIDGQSAGTVVWIENGFVTMEGFTLRNGRGENRVLVPLGQSTPPGGVFAYGRPQNPPHRLRRLIIRDCIGGRGQDGPPNLAYSAGRQGGAGGAAILRAQLDNCLVFGNVGGRGGDGGGGLWLGSGGRGGTGGIEMIEAVSMLDPLRLDFVTVADNAGGLGGAGFGSMQAAMGGGGVTGMGGLSDAPVIEHSIIHLNVPRGTPWLSLSRSAWSNIDGAGGTATLIDLDPGFAAWTKGDFQLGDSSPCIDAGNPLATGIGGRDLDGDPRKYAGRVDLGAHEAVVGINLRQEVRGIFVDAMRMVPGAEHFQIFSFEALGLERGGGPWAGLWFTSPEVAWLQWTLPLGSAPFHFRAAQREQSFGPFHLPSGLVFDALGVAIEPSGAVAFSPVRRMAVM